VVVMGLLKDIISIAVETVETLAIEINIEFERNGLLDSTEYQFNALKRLINSNSFKPNTDLDIVIANSRVMDKTRDYVLLDVTPIIDNSRWARFVYLLMQNPPTQEYHLQGVSRSCQNIQEALNWRNTGYINKKWTPIKLT